MITSKPAKASVEKYKFALVADNFLWHYHIKKKSDLSN